MIALEMLKGKCEFNLNIVGPITNDDLRGFLDYDFVVYHGKKAINEVAELLRLADIFIYSHLNPPCPNSVLEAITTGLPVVGFDSGAMSELCWFSKDLLATVSSEIFQDYGSFSPVKLAEKIELCINQYGKYRRNALDHAKLYYFDECGKRYIQVFEQVMKKQRDARLYK